MTFTVAQCLLWYQLKLNYPAHWRLHISFEHFAYSSLLINHCAVQSACRKIWGELRLRRS